MDYSDKIRVDFEFREKYRIGYCIRWKNTDGVEEYGTIIGHAFSEFVVDIIIQKENGAIGSINSTAKGYQVMKSKHCFDNDCRNCPHLGFRLIGGEDSPYCKIDAGEI